MRAACAEVKPEQALGKRKKMSDEPSRQGKGDEKGRDAIERKRKRMGGVAEQSVKEAERYVDAKDTAAEKVQDEVATQYITPEELKTVMDTLDDYITTFPKTRTGRVLRQQASNASDWSSVLRATGDDRRVDLMDENGKFKARLSLRYDEGIRLMNRYATWFGYIVYTIDRVLKSNSSPWGNERPDTIPENSDPWVFEDREAWSGNAVRMIRNNVIKWEAEQLKRKSGQGCRLNPWLHIWLVAIHCDPEDFTGHGVEKFRPHLREDPTGRVDPHMLTCLLTVAVSV